MSGRSFSHHCSLGIRCLWTGGSGREDCPRQPRRPREAWTIERFHEVRDTVLYAPRNPAASTSLVNSESLDNELLTLTPAAVSLCRSRF